MCKKVLIGRCWFIQLLFCWTHIPLWVTIRQHLFINQMKAKKSFRARLFAKATPTWLITITTGFCFSMAPFVWLPDSGEWTILHCMIPLPLLDYRPRVDWWPTTNVCLCSAKEQLIKPASSNEICLTHGKCALALSASSCACMTDTHITRSCIELLKIEFWYD